MTKFHELQKMRKVDRLLSEAHSLLVDVHEARQEREEFVEGDALTTAIREVAGAIDRLRTCGESPDYLPGWERK